MVDFVHVDAVLLLRLYALIVIEHGTRPAHMADITANPRWRVEDPGSPQLHDGPPPGCHFSQVLIRDRAGQFTGSFDAAFQADGTRILTQPTAAAQSERDLRKDDRYGTGSAENKSWADLRTSTGSPRDSTPLTVRRWSARRLYRTGVQPVQHHRPRSVA